MSSAKFGILQIVRLQMEYFGRNRIFAAMKKAIDLFTELGARLASFGQDDISRQVIARAQSDNGWFTPQDIRRAVSAVADEMLQWENLRAWLSCYPVPAAVPRRVLVVMAGNIPLVGFFDLLCVVASGHRCLIKPSSKDTVLMEYVVGLMRELDPHVAVEFSDGTNTAVDAVIATGSDNANRYFRSRYAGIPALLRGSRHSVAVLSGRETEAQLCGLADDIFAYSGLGCRSVSMVFVPRGSELHLQAPPMNVKYKQNYRQTKAVLTMQDIPYIDLGTALLVCERNFPSALSQINYAYYDDLAEVEMWLAEHDAQLQCVATECMVHSRQTNLGRAQSPSLRDYPDDQDVMEFLAMIRK